MSVLFADVFVGVGVVGVVVGGCVVLWFVVVGCRCWLVVVCCCWRCSRWCMLLVVLVCCVLLLVLLFVVAVCYCHCALLLVDVV